MKCPECQNEMKQICMYEADEKYNTDWHCDECGISATLSWYPKKVDKNHYVTLTY